MSYNRLLLERKIKEFLEEDCHFQDVTASIISENAQSSAKIVAKSKGVIAGLEEIEIIYNLLNVSIKILKKDGQAVNSGDVLVELKGNTRNILLGERVGLNLMTHMSAVTSTVKKYVELISVLKNSVKIACTRKTLPGLRIFEKKAVILGGGDPHRFSMDDMILLKDTHLKFYKGDVQRLLKEIKEKASFTKKIEIEIEKIEDVLIAAQNGADIIMLDNMSPEEIKKAIKILKDNNFREKVIIEVSGGITEDSLVSYAQSEPDIISMGNITQFPSEHMDISLRFD